MDSVGLPFTTMPDQKHCYVLDVGPKVYVWLGGATSEDQWAAARAHAAKLVEDKRLNVSSVCRDIDTGFWSFLGTEDGSSVDLLPFEDARARTCERLPVR